MRAIASSQFVGRVSCRIFNIATGSATKDRYTRCRICGSEKIIKRGAVEFYIGYAWPIYDCNGCGCRFTLHKSSTYDLLYSERSSCYSRYITQAEICKTLFDRGDLP